MVEMVVLVEMSGWMAGRRRWMDVMVVLGGWAVEAHHHAGLAVAAAGGGEVG